MQSRMLYITLTIVLLRNYVSLGFHYTVSRDVGTNSGVACDSNIMEKIDSKSLREFQIFLKLRGIKI